MKLLFVADLHYALKQFDWLAANASNYDVVVIGGDLLDLSSALDLDVQIVVMGKYFTRLRQLTKLVVSSGNHDGDSRNAADESVARWLLEAKAPWLFVDGDSVEIDGTLITVCPWWDGPVSRAELEGQIARDALKTKSKWIWIHHAPPDRSRVSWTGKQFGGDEFLSEWIAQYQPDLVLSGHIHNAPFYSDGSWIDRLGRTWIFNPGRQIGACPSCLSFDLERMTAAWISVEGQEVRELRLPLPESAVRGKAKQSV
ncbi:MAG: metallophosphoesterase [Verrucomicrobiota bacterium]|nr:metallophosphoesterase [Verrucomicrobiota bacterium]